jgi:hypothetical protein
MKKVLYGLVVVVALLVFAVAYLLWPRLTQKEQEKVAQAGLTSNEVAANGPLPGDVTAYSKQQACVAASPNPGYYHSLNGAEMEDAARSALYACIPFTGSYAGPNKVFAWRGEDDYQAASYLDNGKPGEVYIVGGDFPAPKGQVPSGPFVAKADATTGKQIWRTYLDNGNASGTWIMNTNLNILPNGNIVEVWSNKIVVLDGNTGLILKSATLPPGPGPVIDMNYKHVTIAPDSTLIVKDQTRPSGCTLQGAPAIMQCLKQGMKQAPSVIVAVDPNTLRVLDKITLPEPATVPHVITTFGGKIAIYVGVNSGALRYFWDPDRKKLSRDVSWSVDPMKPGQTTSDAPSVIGDWIVLQTNGIGSDTVASSIVAVSQKDPKNVHVIFPFGQLAKGERSLAPPKPEVDPENSMIYSADMGMGKVAGIKLDQGTGEMKTAFVLDDTTSGFQPLIGPRDERVLIISNFVRNVPGMPILLTLATQNYKEQVTWRDAGTGRLLAASDFFEPMGVNNLITPGYGGRFYYLTSKGVIVMQVMPGS